MYFTEMYLNATPTIHRNFIRFRLPDQNSVNIICFACRLCIKISKILKAVTYETYNKYNLHDKHYQAEMFTSALTCNKNLCKLEK